MSADAITITYTADEVRALNNGNDILRDAQSRAQSLALSEGRRLTGEKYTASNMDGGGISVSFPATSAPGSTKPEALEIPAYLVAEIPAAADHPNGMIRILDNPQGTAQSNGSTWTSDVDGSDLGEGGGI